MTTTAAPPWPPAVPGPLPFAPKLKAAAVAATIQRHLDTRTPLSVIRLGDGEAVVMAYPDEVGEEPLAEFTRSWFGQHAPNPQQRRYLADQLRGAIRHADIIGVVRGDQVDKFTAVRYLLDRYKLVNEHAQIGSLSLHRNMQEEGLYDQLLAGRDHVGLVTCRDIGSVIQQHFNIGKITTYLVPEAVKHSKEPRAVQRHFPDRFDELNRTLKVPQPGMLFLVGAGPCGKVYCRWIKERGGIAVDIGSVFDGWAGRPTRAYMRSKNPDGSFQLQARYELSQRQKPDA